MRFVQIVQTGPGNEVTREIKGLAITVTTFVSKNAEILIFFRNGTDFTHKITPVVICGPPPPSSPCLAALESTYISATCSAYRES